MTAAPAPARSPAGTPSPAETALRDRLRSAWISGRVDPDVQPPSGPQRLWDGLTRGALDLVYPPRCPLTGANLSDQPSPLLSAIAFDALEIFSGAQCPRCGAPRPADSGEGYTGSAAAGRCRLCARAPGDFRLGTCLWPYEGAGRDLILAYKFGGERQLAPLFGRWLYLAGRAAGLFQDGPWITAAPASQVLGGAMLQEDHAAALATEIVATDQSSRQPIGLRLLSAPLRKIRTTAPQATLNLQERLKSPAGSMACATRLDRDTVVVVDDVLTTLATMAEAARALTAAGAGEVRVLALARTL